MLSVDSITTDHAAYAARRADARARMIPLRRERRVRLGDLLVGEFENAETLAYQVQEMVFTERLTTRTAVAHEVAVYSRLLPSSHLLVATLFIELDDPRTIREELARLAGVQHALRLRVDGATVVGEEIPGIDEDPGVPSTTVSVHSVRFPLSDAIRDAFRDPEVPAELAVEHPVYQESAALRGATRLALIADLAVAG